MKTVNRYAADFIPTYPNEANPQYFAQRLLDGVTSAVTGMGILAIFFFLLTM